MHIANCPSCGAPVEFKSAASIFAVCEYCRSTLVRHDRELENIGRMAELLEDASPVRLGTEGRYRGVHFAVIGRIQLRYGQGVWNEWHLLFDDQRSGWLSDAGGQYVVSFAKWTDEPLPAFDDLQVEQTLLLDGRPYIVTNLESATCVAGEGELPFKIGAGYAAPVADLRAGAAFATIDYSDAGNGRPPLVFLGEAVAFEDLAFANLRDGAAQPPQKKIEARVLRCPSCGAPLNLHAASIETAACGSCTAIVAVADDRLRILLESQGTPKDQPALALGSKGKLRGAEYEVIGFLRRRTLVEGVEYAWREYLLLGPEGDFRWLTEYNGHWNFVTTLNASLGGGTSTVVHYQGSAFQHFQSAKAEVDFVLGEFYWQVTRGDVAEVADYVAPPRVLSRERTATEVSWSLGEYLEPEEVGAAFKPKVALPPRIGIGANQPSRHEEAHRKVCRMFWRFAVAAVVIQVGTWLIAPNKTLLQQHLPLAAAAAEEPMTTGEFRVGSTSNLTVRNRTNLTNTWVELTLTLVDKDTGQAYGATREISYYEGIDGGESWSEGSRDDEVVFKKVPPGTYYLTVDADLPTDRPAAASGTLEVVRDAPVWSNLLLAIVFLVLFPIYTRWRWASFEVRRWADSDHPKISSSGDDDD